MLSALRKRVHFGPATAIAFLALVFAITGGAFAATGGNGGGSSHATLIASAAKAKSKVKVGPRGPAGPAGKNGANGANGAAGPQGPQGPKGENGTTARTAPPARTARTAPTVKACRPVNSRARMNRRTNRVRGLVARSSKWKAPARRRRLRAMVAAAPVVAVGIPKRCRMGRRETGTWSVDEKRICWREKVVEADDRDFVPDSASRTRPNTARPRRSKKSVSRIKRKHEP